MSVLLREWATRRLRSGDLTALRCISQGSTKGDDERVSRLARRGFVARRKNGRPSVTPRGWVALLIKRVSLN